MKDRQFTYGERVIIPFQIDERDADRVQSNTDMTTGGYSLTLLVLRDGQVTEDNYDSATYVTWETQASGTGYWAWSQADSRDQTKWPIGTSRVDMWFESSDPPVHLGSAEITIAPSATGGLP